MIATSLQNAAPLPADLPQCDWRVGTRLPPIFYCRHSAVHSQNSLVNAGICNQCAQRSQMPRLPRPFIDDPLVPREPPAPARLEYISLERLAADVRRLVGQLPSNLSGVAGIPRSGMIPAVQISLMLHLPLFELCRQKGLRAMGHGWRLGDYERHDGPLLVVDDAVYSGDAMAAAREELQRIRPQQRDLFAALYPVPEAVSSLDFYAHPLPPPQFFEWNLLNSNHTRGFAVDFDGVLCEDWPGGDEEGEEYQTFVASGPPRWLPRYATVPLIVTARLEKHRAATEAWLQRHAARYGKLVMGPWKTTQERNQRYHAGELKGRAYAESNCALFIESDDEQALMIFEAAKKPVLCPTSGRIFQ
jgi:uncharacterized HAD superfamily protein